MGKKTLVRKFHIWDKDRVYQGEYNGNDGGIPAIERWPYYLEIMPPECPALPEPEYPDGWYLVHFDGKNDLLLRQKRGGVAFDEQGNSRAYWREYEEVVASLGDVKFLYGRDE